MNSLLCSSTSFTLLPSKITTTTPSTSSKSLTLTLHNHHHFPSRLLSKPTSRRLYSSRSPPSADISPTGIAPFDDFTEKDWSFLEEDNVNSVSEAAKKSTRIIESAAIGESSHVVVCLGTDGFIDRVKESIDDRGCRLFVVHYSLYMLALVKERYDEVKCWQGDIVDLPERWAPFDVVFLSYFPALPCSLDRLLGALVARCSPGGRVVISYPQGREIIEKQRQRHPDMVTGNLPDKITLEKIAADNSFEIVEFVDEPTFYLATLRYSKV